MSSVLLPRFRLLCFIATCAALPLAAAPTGSFDVRAFGATGDGKTIDSIAINKAIDAAVAAGGGTVYFPAGTYASYSVRLKSNIALYLDQGATLLAADPPPEGTPGGYDEAEPNVWEKYQDYGHTHWHNSLIWGENLENVSILGPGRIFGKGLSRGLGRSRKDPLPGEPAIPRAGGPPGGAGRANAPQAPGAAAAAPFGYPSVGDSLPPGVGNKAIALKNCHNVIFRDFTIFHGGHFGILVTGVDNFTIDNLKIDTNRDGMDIDCCQNVRLSNCTVNSPNDDGICLKSSFGLGVVRASENITITNCQVSGYAEGSLLDGTYKHAERDRGGPTGRIKFGTEGNGGFRNISISNCVFEFCRGIALEEVDGGLMEDVSITNITMRNIVNAPIFIRLGARLRGPDNPPVGTARRINISNIVAQNVAPDYGILIVGLPGHAIEDVRISNILINYQGGGTAEQAVREVPEGEQEYPEPSRFGFIPAYGIFARHVKGLSFDHIDLRYAKTEQRPAVMLTDVTGADFDHVKLQHEVSVPLFVLKGVTGFDVHNSPGLPETHRETRIENDKL